MIRPFQLGDLLLVQRLGRQATRLNAIQALLQPRLPTAMALGSIVPWAGSNEYTYVLRQQRNSLAHAGFIQIQKRPGRPESDIVLLAPALDTPWGHPAIWEKLLAHYAQTAVQQQIKRIYVDVPDQPLLVNTFAQVGFRTYTRQTIWRLTPRDITHSGVFGSNPADEPHNSKLKIRQQNKVDIWALLQLYSRVTPKDVQAAEGMRYQLNENGRMSHAKIKEQVKPLILDWWQSNNSTTSVLLDKDEIKGCILVGRTVHGCWMRIVTDTLNPNPEYLHKLLQHGLRYVDPSQYPIYIGVRSYHGGMSNLLSEYGFAPFTDRARMVRQVHAWARMTIQRTVPTLDAVGEAVPTSFSRYQ